MDIWTIAAQLGFGLLIKRWPVLAKWPDKLIPVFNAILAVLIQLVHPTASTADSLAVVPMVHHGHPGWWAFWQFIQPILLNTLMSTGIFSAVKNVAQHAGGAK